MLTSKSLRPAAGDLVAPRAASSPTSQLPGETSSPSHRSSRRPPDRYEGVASDLSSSKSHNMNDPTHATKLTTSKFPSNSQTPSQSNPSPTSNYKPPSSRPSIPQQTSRMPSTPSYHSARKSSSSTTMSTSSSSLRTPHVRAETLPEHEFPSHPNASTFGRTASANILSLGQASTSSSRSLSLPSLSSTTTTSSRGASVPFQTPPSSFSSATTNSPHSRKASGDLLPNHPHESRTKPPSSSPALDAIPHKLALDDMKRLLSKPASILSGSESDGYRSLGRSANRAGTVVSSDDDAGGGGYRSSPGRLSSQVRDRLGVRTGTTSEEAEDHSFLSLGHTLPLPTSTTIVQNNPSTDKRIKNVLKRRPSNGAKVPNLTIFPASYTEAKLKPRTGIASRSRSLPGNPLPRHPPSGESADTSGLTPAGAVAMAYKQQQLEERRRQQEEQEKLKKEKDVSTPLSSSSGSSTDHATPKVSSTPEASTSRLPDYIVSSPPSPPSTPYYTVFGSTSGKVVAVGGPEDSWSDIATRSSSPGSSDVASSKFFQRTQSQRSLRHRKSFGKIVQPAIRRSTSSPESWIPSPEEPLPTPPRTAWKPPQDSVRASPTIPEFSTSAPINAFMGRKPSASAESTPSDIGADLKTTPSRPSRSLHRTSPSTSRISSPIRKLPSVPRFSSPPPVPDTPTNPNRTSTSSHATARPRSYANSLASSPTAQFRDRATIKPAWTEQEKTDMWNDLLERSARAGGTLHLRGDDGLASDQLRFSAATVSDSEVE
ncbi:hypothetical protein ARMSODRAFT_503066 [Armillaria solidipes]|uniref:Uncharacterized protein n=1 Tax=Armillaria solidipes TaxID=1076256 RepID=A0A2H3BZK5_9AGAR|nr:hypothetical protein ARMSODRAFT_503066 [Armillaria solidipes]